MGTLCCQGGPAASPIAPQLLCGSVHFRDGCLEEQKIVKKLQDLVLLLLFWHFGLEGCLCLRCACQFSVAVPACAGGRCWELVPWCLSTAARRYLVKDSDLVSFLTDLHFPPFLLLFSFAYNRAISFQSRNLFAEHVVVRCVWFCFSIHFHKKSPLMSCVKIADLLPRQFG